MTTTVFFRLLDQDDKGTALMEAIADVTHGWSNDEAFLSNPLDFKQVPGSPFAYWVSDALRRKFQELPSVEGSGRTVKQGLATADDFRFLRTWWEILLNHVLDSNNGPYNDTKSFQSWCRKRMREGMQWVPFTKGGNYSPYYTEIHLVVNWGNEGGEIKNNLNSDGKIRSNVWMLDETASNLFFRPCLTWPLRASRFAPSILASGSIFSVRGYSIHADESDLGWILGLGNSATFDYIFKTLLGRFGFPEFVVGMLQKLPIPDLNQNDRDLLWSISSSSVELTRDLHYTNEVSHAFKLPILLADANAAIGEQTNRWEQHMVNAKTRLIRNQSQIDEIAYRVYNIDNEDRSSIETSLRRSRTSDRPIDAVETYADEEEGDNSSDIATNLDRFSLVTDLISYAVGCTFGRWDVRIARDPTLAPKLADPFDPLPVCSPGMLVGTDGLPAKSGGIVSETWLRARPNAITLPPAGAVEQGTITDAEYPLPLAWDGILPDDPDHSADLTGRVRRVFDLLFGERAGAIEQEVCEILGVRGLREYLSRPAGFFADHLQRYSKSRRKAPIYWPLSTKSGAYTLWLYYPRLTSDTLYTAVVQYIEPKIAAVQRELAELERRAESATGREGARLRQQVSEMRALISELNDLQGELRRVAALPYKPDLNDGVIINAAPLHELFRLPKWKQDTRDTWAKLERGDYDWAHLALNVWPERVRDKCRADRSLAIAHQLEHLYEGAVPEARAPRKRRSKGGQTP